MIVPVETKMGMVYTLHLRVIYSHHRALFTKSGNLFADGSQPQLEPWICNRSGDMGRADLWPGDYQLFPPCCLMNGCSYSEMPHLMRPLQVVLSCARTSHEPWSMSHLFRGTLTVSLYLFLGRPRGPQSWVTKEHFLGPMVGHACNMTGPM